MNAIESLKNSQNKGETLEYMQTHSHLLNTGIFSFIICTRVRPSSPSRSRYASISISPHFSMSISRLLSSCHSILPFWVYIHIFSKIANTIRIKVTNKVLCKRDDRGENKVDAGAPAAASVAAAVEAAMKHTNCV